MSDEKLDAETEAVCEEAALGLWQAASQKILWPRIVDLARKVQAIERERCAKIAEDWNARWSRTSRVAAAIREQS